MSESFNRTGETRLRAAVESAPSGLLLTEAEGRIVLVNREVERLFGYAREELLGQPIELLIPMRDRERHPDYRRGFRGDPRVRAMGAGRDLHGQRKDGVEVPVEVGLTPVATPEGLFVIGAVVDISARKQAEAEQRRAAEQLRQAQKLEAIGTLAGGIAHDFNNVLAAILGYAELLELELTNLPSAREDAREIIVAAQRGRELVQQLQAFSRQRDTVFAPVEVPAIVTEVHQLLRASLPPSVQLSVISEPDVEPVLANATSLHRIVMNLATNAAHAVPEGGDVCIRVQRRFVPEPHTRENPELREGWYTVLSVRDNGIGMAADTVARANHSSRPSRKVRAQASGSPSSTASCNRTAGPWRSTAPSARAPRRAATFRRSTPRQRNKRRAPDLGTRRLRSVRTARESDVHAVALLELLATAARTRIVAPRGAVVDRPRGSTAPRRE